MVGEINSSVKFPETNNISAGEKGFRHAEIFEKEKTEISEGEAVKIRYQVSWEFK